MSTGTLRIADCTLGPGEPVVVIAEIGVNHDGSVVRAIELVRIAAKCGADAVKLQVFSAAALMHASSRFAAYQQDRCDDADPAAMLRRYELAPAEVRRVVDEIRRLGMLPLATPFSPGDVDVLAELDLPAVKIASPDLVNRPLLQRAAELGRPLLVSTGAATMGEVVTAVGWLERWGAPFALLHCVSSYPTPADQANLCWIGELAATFAVPVGYSDHTTDVVTGAFATAAGACVVERHLTYDRAAAGPDHAASSDPAEFAQYVRLVRQAQVLRGAPGKRVLDVEQDVRRVSRQSLVLARDVAAGQLISSHDVTVQRPGTGIPAALVEAALGRRVRLPLRAGTLLRWDMLSDAA